MRPRKLLFALLVVSSGVLAARAPRGVDTDQHKILVGPNVLVSDDNSGPHYEPALAADLSTAASRRLLGAAFVRLDGSSRRIAKTYASTDGGSTWIDSTPAWLQGATGGTDVQVAFDSRGTAYFLSLVQLDEDGAYLNRSKDGGRSWEKETLVCHQGDYPQMIVDQSTGKYAGRIYIGMQPGANMYRSEDGGATFIGPVKVATGGGKVVRSPVVLSDGRLFVPVMQWVENPNGTTQAEPVRFATSVDGGASFSELKPANGTADLFAGRRGTPLMVDPDFAVDTHTSKYKDRLYEVWGDTHAGELRLYLSSSSDGGTHWTGPVRIDPDAPHESSEFLPAIAVNKDGVIGVQWFDTRGFPDDNSYNVYFAASFDGGARFSAPVRVSSAVSRADALGNIMLFDCRGASVECGVGYKRWPKPGEYMGLTSDGGGAFHLMWSDSRGRSYQIYTAQVLVSPRPTAPSLEEADLTQSMEFRYDPIDYDPAKRIFSLPVRLYNKSSQDLYGPFRVEIIGGLQQAEVLNAQNKEHGIGASFDYSGALGDLDGLDPGGITEPVSWQFRITDDRLDGVNALRNTVRIIGFVRRGTIR